MTSSQAAPRTPLYLPTIDAYDLWAPHYDTDGNFLQILDSHLLDELLPRWIASLPPSPNVIDLGCGTGRNTVRLLSIDGADVMGLDLSSKMLEIARGRCSQALSTLATSPGIPKASAVDFALFDIMNFESPCTGDSIKCSNKEIKGTGKSSDPVDDKVQLKDSADAILSTLVLEHVPLRVFFAYCAHVLRPGGSLLVTNMAEDMGRVSQAGFKDPETGVKIRPTSFTHGIEETVKEAYTHGFTIEGDVQERDVRLEDIEKLGLGDRGKKWIGVKVCE